MRHLALFFWFCVLAWPGAAEAAVRIEFHSRDTDNRFPHAFIALSGTVDSTGEPIDAAYGFTLKGHVRLRHLSQPTTGYVHRLKRADFPKSDLHFGFDLTDAEYAAVIARVDHWDALPQPSYRVRDSNCVTFIADIAMTLGLDAAMAPGLEIRPRSFLESVHARNKDRIAQRVSAASTVSSGPS